MKRWLLPIALLLSLGVNLGILGAIAASRLRPHGPPAWQQAPEAPPGARLERLADYLGLEGERRDAFLEIQRRFFRTLLLERQALEELRSEVRRQTMSDDPDRERLERLTAELGTRYAALDRALVTNIIETRALLDRRQERRFFEVLQSMRSRRAVAGPGSRPGPGPGPALGRGPGPAPPRRRPPPR